MCDILKINIGKARDWDKIVKMLKLNSDMMDKLKNYDMKKIDGNLAAKIRKSVTEKNLTLENC